MMMMKKKKKRVIMKVFLITTVLHNKRRLRGLKRKIYFLFKDLLALVKLLFFAQSSLIGPTVIGEIKF
jgi:hypothetical protein